MSDIDQTIRELFSKLLDRRAKIEELKERTGRSWKTNGTFKLIGAATPTNIQTASVEVVEEVATHLCIIRNARRQAASELDVAEISYKIHGYDAGDWFDDLNKRLAMINIREEETKLAALETRLNQVLSPEERRRIEVDLLAKELGDTQ